MKYRFNNPSFRKKHPIAICLSIIAIIAVIAVILYFVLRPCSNPNIHEGLQLLATPTQNTEKKVVVYMINWGPPQTLAEQGQTVADYQKNLYPYATHIVVAFAKNYVWDPNLPNPDGTFGGNAPGVDCSECVQFSPPYGYDTHSDFIADARAHGNPKLKLIMSYGGAGMGSGASKTVDTTNWKECKSGDAYNIANLLVDCMQHPDNYRNTIKGCLPTGGDALQASTGVSIGYDGIDIDYEIKAKENGIVDTLTVALYNKFQGIVPKPLLTHVPMNYYFTQPDGNDTTYYNILKKLSDNIDFISIQMYNNEPVPEDDQSGCKENFNKAVEAMGGNASKVVPLVANDKLGANDNCTASSIGACWTAKGSGNGKMTVQNLACMYNKFNPSFGGLGFWKYSPTNTLPKAMKTALQCKVDLQDIESDSSCTLAACHCCPSLPPDAGGMYCGGDQDDACLAGAARARATCSAPGDTVQCSGYGGTCYEVTPCVTPGQGLI